VARFKYPPHWVPVSMLFRAMREIDPTTGKSRGLISLERAAAPRNLAFVFTNSGGGWQQVAAFLGAELRQLLQRREPATAHAAVTLILGAAGDVARGIALRDTADVEHRRIVDAMLGNLRATALHQLSHAVGAVEGTLPELATALLYLVPLETWQVLPANVAAELVQLSDVESLAEPLKSDVSVLRRQLAELQACTPAGAATIALSQE
jgi:glutathione gamma-glutamylcysteinyltransferase